MVYLFYSLSINRPAESPFSYVTHSWDISASTICTISILVYVMAHQPLPHPNGDAEADKVDNPTFSPPLGTSTNCFCPSLRCELLHLVLGFCLSTSMPC